MTEITPHLAYVYCALMGCVVGAMITGFVIAWIARMFDKEKDMACKQHGECLGCSVAAVEDEIKEINAKCQPLWDAYQDIDAKLAQQQANLRGYIDEQLVKQEARISTHGVQIYSLCGKVSNLEKI